MASHLSWVQSQNLIHCILIPVYWPPDISDLTSSRSPYSSSPLHQLSPHSSDTPGMQLRTFMLDVLAAFSAWKPIPRGLSRLDSL